VRDERLARVFRAQPGYLTVKCKVFTDEVD